MRESWETSLRSKCFLASGCCSLPGHRQQKQCVLVERAILPPLLGIPKEVQCPFSCEDPWAEPREAVGLSIPGKLS